jgi:hypothetical protein
MIFKLRWLPGFNLLPAMPKWNYKEHQPERHDPLKYIHPSGSWGMG